MIWALKIIIKIILKKLPFSYRFWKISGLFKHGRMDQFEYSKKIFFSHIEEMMQINSDKKQPIILEIGPGDSILSAIYGKIYKAKKFYLIDVDSYATKDILFYKSIVKNLISFGFEINFGPDDFNTFEELLQICNAEYLTKGVSSFQNIENDSVDYIFSHSVMEHIRLSEIGLLIKEMFRVLKFGTGVMKHNINYKDHLTESLNNLRFSKKIWESEFFANSGFYTNRIPAFEMHRIFKLEGFSLYRENFGQWDKLPLARKHIHKDFNKFSNEDLINRTSSFLAQKK